MDITNQPIEGSDEAVSGAVETNNALSVEIDGKPKEKETAELWEEKFSDGVAEAEGDEKRKDGGAEAGPSTISLVKRCCEEFDAKFDESFATKKRKTALNPMELSYEVVEADEQIDPAMKKLRELGEGRPLLAVDLEGDRLSRKGKLSIVSVATENDTFLFDIQKLGAGVFDKGLRDLLQDPGRQKLTFDCRQDSDCLWHQYNVKLTNVLDLQLMEVIYRGEASTHLNLRTNKRTIDVPRVPSLKKCLENYVEDDDLVKAKEAVQHSAGVWLTRPLDRSFLQYAAADVIGMLRLYGVLREKVEKMSAMEQLRDVSNRYLDFYRFKVDRSYDMYEENPFLPWRIFQSTYNKGVQCMGCKRNFPNADFIKIQKRQRVQKCPVCRMIYKKK